MKRIEYLLKNNRFMQAIYIAVFSIFFKFVGLFIKIDKNLILFSSYSGKSFNDSPRVLYEAISSNPKYKQFNCVWAFVNVSKYCDRMSCRIVKQDSFKYFVTALKAKYWITNVNIERGLHIKKKKTIYLNTWHGSGPKTVGNAVKNRRDYNLSNVDFLLADGDFLKNIFIRDFRAKDENIKLIGRPREDILYKYKDNPLKIKNKILNKYNLPINKKYILFAPTWRDSSDHGKSYSLNKLFDLEKWVEKLGNDYVILFRAHSITSDYNVYENNNIVNVTYIDDINELYLVADILISDYSSCFVDYSILEKPILCFAPDYNSYIKERGLYYDLNNYFTNGVILSEDDLLNAIKNINYKKEVANSIRYKNTFVSNGGHSTENCLKLLFGEKCQD